MLCKQENVYVNFGRLWIQKKAGPTPKDKREKGKKRQLYQFIFFDFDGTICDTGPGIMDAAACALSSFGLQYTDGELRAFIGPSPGRRFQTYYGMDEEQAAEATLVFRQRYAARGKFEHSIYPGMPQLLRGLSAQGRRLAVASSKPLPLVREIMDSYDLAPCFAVIRGGDPEGRLADKALVLGMAMEEMGVADRSEAVMVGDRDLDVIGARDQGIGCIGAGYGYAEPGELEAAGALAVAKSVPELGELLGAPSALTGRCEGN